MDKKLIALGLVAVLAVPTAAIAAQHGSHSRSKATSTAPRTKAKGSTSRSGLAVRSKPSRTAPVSARTNSKARPRGKTGSARKPKAKASTPRSRTTVRTRRNRTAGTAPISVTINNGGGSGASGTPGVGGLDLPVSLSGGGV